MGLESFQTDFYKEYNETTRQLEEMASKIDSCSNEAERRVQFTAEYDKIASRVDTLQKYFSENTSFLPTFEVRKAQEHLGRLSKMMQEKRELLAPKKKFGFRSKQNMTSLENKIETESAAAAQNSSMTTAQVDMVNVESSCCIKGLRNESIVLKMGAEIDGKDVSIVDVKNTTICLQGSPSVLHIDSIDSCTILCGPVVGSTFINQCTNSKLALACHQLRIHETTNTQFYIHVGSRAIIENTRLVSFAPYAWTFPNLDTHFRAVNFNLDSGSYNFSAIDDFNWLNQSQKSPNWRFLDDGERVKWISDESGQLKTI